MPAKGADRQKRYRERMKALGFKQVTVSVPTEHLDEFVKVAAKYREDHLKSLGLEGEGKADD